MKLSNICFIWKIANSAIAIFANQVSGRFLLVTPAQAERLIFSV